MVDLPPPEPLRIILISPLLSAKLMSSRTLFSPNERWTWRNSTAGVASSSASVDLELSSSAFSGRGESSGGIASSSRVVISAPHFMNKMIAANAPGELQDDHKETDQSLLVGLLAMSDGRDAVGGTELLQRAHCLSNDSERRTRLGRSEHLSVVSADFSQNSGES